MTNTSTTQPYTTLEQADRHATCGQCKPIYIPTDRLHYHRICCTSRCPGISRIQKEHRMESNTSGSLKTSAPLPGPVPAGYGPHHESYSCELRVQLQPLLPRARRAEQVSQHAWNSKGAQLYAPYCSEGTQQCTGQNAAHMRYRSGSNSQSTIGRNAHPNAITKDALNTCNVARHRAKHCTH